MSLKFAIPMAAAAACLAFAGAAHAQTYTEVGDAGDLPATAQAITGVAGVTYTSISGTTTATSGRLFDSDMYAITIANAVYFSASDTAFVSGANNFDSQIALFNSSGVGVYSNDDAATGGEQSSLTTGSTLLVPGTYYLLISGSGRYAIDSTSALIFPNFNDGTTSATATVAASSALPINGYTGSSNEGGKYVIALSIALPTAVPEPSSLAALATGVGGLMLLLRRRSSK